MTKKELAQIEAEVSRQLLGIFSGILFHHQTFETGKPARVTYCFDRPEWDTLRERYGLIELAGKGSDLQRAKRLLHSLAPKLTHSSFYDNHVPCNALDLLAYSLNDPEHGINCLNKAKILEECCLALGIYARRVFLMPYSPYDFDNHVVTEIYDRKLKKWIMLDPTTDGLFVDDAGVPLSLLEMRERFANAQFVTYVRSTDRLKDLPALQEKYIDQNAYICKNLFFFYVDGDSTFGETDRTLVFVPPHVSIKENRIANVKYQIAHMPEEYKDLLPQLKEDLEKRKNAPEVERTDLSAMLCAPI